MPLYSFVQLNIKNAYLLWKIEESVETLNELVTLSTTEKEEYVNIRHTGKKKEWLAARHSLSYLLTQLGNAPSSLYKNEKGQPILTTNSAHISISHCKDFALVALSGDNLIGVDIEQPHNKLRIIQHKFLSESEIKSAKNNLSILCIYWCAKEAIYKALGGNNITIKHGIYIYPFIYGPCGVVWGHVEKQLFKIQYNTAATNKPYYLAWAQKA